MIKLGLIGYPVSHSLSPKIQNAALKACGLEGDYSLFPIAPDDMPALKDLLDRVRSGEITGLNVTIPHKQNVIQFMDDLTPTAKSIGAVSVIYLREKKLIGDNADAPGFLSDLNRFLTTETHSHNDTNALVLGAGGSARAVVYALINDGWNVTIASRRIEQSQELAAQFKTANAIDFNFQTFKLSDMQLIVNTTPLGMTPNIKHRRCLRIFYCPVMQLFMIWSTIHARRNWCAMLVHKDCKRPQVWVCLLNKPRSDSNCGRETNFATKYSEMLSNNTWRIQCH
jgi:shikimate dehydrogenase